MKKLISTFAFVLGVVAFSFAQDATNTAQSEGADALTKSKLSGIYTLVLPEGTTDKEVEEAASYYTDFFTVDFDEASREASIEIVGEAPSSARVMLRFLSVCGVNFVDVDGEAKQLQSFYAEHVK